MLSIKKMYNYIRKNGTRRQNLELDLHYDGIHAIVECIKEDKNLLCLNKKFDLKQ